MLTLSLDIQNSDTRPIPEMMTNWFQKRFLIFIQQYSAHQPSLINSVSLPQQQKGEKKNLFFSLSNSNYEYMYNVFKYDMLSSLLINK